MRAALGQPEQSKAGLGLETPRDTGRMGAGDWAPDDRRETKIAGGVFALLVAVAVMA